VAALFGLGLMAKPVLVVLPVTLLLLDWWPLGRGRAAGGTRDRLAGLLGEKVPLLLAAAAALVTVAAQRHGGMIQDLADFPPLSRAANASLALVRHLTHVCWPLDLLPHYPHRRGATPLLPALASALLLLGLTLGAVRRRRRAPWVLAGWLWYLTVLLPVLGLVQVGQQALADLGQLAEARSQFARVVRERPDHEPARRLLALWR
jgi:hypothetical protein